MNTINSTAEEKMLENRIIVIGGDEIDSTIANRIMKGLFLLDSDNHKPIWIYINSPGGSVSDGWTIIDTMNAVKAPVYTVNVGLCASMAAAIFSAGEKRYMLPHAFTMIHQVSCNVGGNIQDISVMLQHSEVLNKLTMNFIAERSGKKYDDIINMTHRDHWMDAKESIEFGIADKIFGEGD